MPVLLLYATTRARTVTGEDSGELITAAYQVGVAHPPGFPIWVLLTKGFQATFSAVNPADAAALGSAITTSAAIGLVALLALRLTRSLGASLLGAWVVAVGHEIWNHATIAEVYALNLLILAASLLLFDRWRESPTRARFFALALVYGCGLATHPTFHLFLPVFGIAAVVHEPRILLDWRTIGLGLLGLALPHLAYLEVLIAAASDPFLSWGVRPGVSSVIGHYLREVYSHGPPNTAANGTKILSQLQAQSAFVLDNVSLPGLIAASLGLVLLVRSSRVMGVLLAALAVLGTVGLLLFINFDVEREDLFANRVFLMSAYLVLGVGIAAAASGLAKRLPEVARRGAVRLALVIPLLVAAFEYRAHDRTNYYWSEDYGRAILADLPKNTILLPGGDTSTFPLLYLQACRGFRKDVVIIDRTGSIERDEALALLPEKTRSRLAAAPEDALINAILTLSGRPVVSLRPERAPSEIDVVYEPFGLGFMAIPSRDAAARGKLADAREAFFKKLALRNETIPTVEDYTADVIRAHVAQARALNFFRSGNSAAALDQCAFAARWGEGIKETLNNVGSLIAENGLPDRSEHYFREALVIRADYSLARQNLVVVLRNQEKNDEAFEEARFGATLDPKDGFFFREATDLAKARRNSMALRALCDARIKAVPDDPAPHRLLGEWALDVDHAPVLARAHFEAALAADPGDKRSARKLAKLEEEGRPGPDVLARDSGDRDPNAEFAALLPPPFSAVRRDEERPARVRRFGGDGAQAAVIGAVEMQSILGQLRMPRSFNPTAGLEFSGRPFRRPERGDPTTVADETEEP